MEQNQLIKNASYASIAAGLAILAVKCVGWTESDSVSLFASLIDSLLDITSAFLSAIAIQIALSPADDNHRFGHNKVQDLAVFAQAVFFIGSGGLTLFVSIKQLYKGHVIQNYESGLISMGLCLLIGFALLIYQTYVIRKTDSHIIKADKIHYISDCASNIAVIISIAGSQYFQKLDGIFGILISGYIIFSAIGIMQGAIKNLIDEEFSKEDKEKVLQIPIIPVKDSEKNSILSCSEILRFLYENGISSIFVEGGGQTISYLLQADCISILHLHIAPLILGSGRASFILPAINSIDQGLRFKMKHFDLDGEILIELALIK